MDNYNKVAKLIDLYKRTKEDFVEMNDDVDSNGILNIIIDGGVIQR